MYHTYAKAFFTSALLLTALTPTFAQNVNYADANRKGENSPYSRYGIGEHRNGLNPLLRAMGSVSSAYANPFAVNTDNPASYSHLQLTTYEAGAEFRQRTVSTGQEKYTTGIGALSYLNVAFPGGKYLGFNIGLRPETRTFYNLTDTSFAPGFGNSYTTYFGDGSLNYGFIGASGKYKGFSVGVNFGYMFGTIDKSVNMQQLGDTEKVHNAIFVNSTKIGGIYWKTGALYTGKLNEKLGIRVGGTLTMSQELDATRDEYWVSYRTYGDTAYRKEGIKNKMVLPMSYSIGAQLFNNEKWMAGIDFTGAQWSQFRNFGSVDSVADNTMKISVGGEYTPNATSLRKYFQRVTYRLGFYYGTDQIRLRNTDMNYYALTAGASFPFRRSTDRIHTAFEIGKRGTTANGLLSENFIRFSVGISLNDRWFQPSRLN